MEKVLMQPCKYILEYQNLDEESDESVPIYVDGYYLGLGKQIRWQDGMFFEYTMAVVADKGTGKIAYMPIEAVNLVGNGIGVHKG